MFLFRYIRILIALLIFVSLSAFFLDFSEVVPHGVHILAHIQLTPAIVSIYPIGSGIIIFAAWLLLTILFGRVYCSAVCPFGIFQDLLTRISKLARGKKFKFQFQHEMTLPRYIFLGLFLGGLVCLPVLVSLLDPYSHFGRTMTWIFRPIYIAGNNLAAGVSDNDKIYYVSNYVNGTAFFVTISVLTFVGILAMFAGRRYCNTVCPVGTLLGIVSRYSIFRIVLRKNCKSCGLCEKNCKGECIDSKAKTVDASRCVACFNCLSVCKFHAIGYETKTGKPKSAALPVQTAAFAPAKSFSRRTVLSWSVFSLLIPSLVRAEKKNTSAKLNDDGIDPSLPRGTSRISYTMDEPVLPPGARDVRRFNKNCTACHLCVTKCPAHVLTPSSTELGLVGFLQPIMQFRHGFCNYDCTICGEVCPNHALSGLHTKEDKYKIQMGQAVFLKENCVLETQGTNCGACAEHCPTGAIKMIPYGEPSSNLAIPEVNVELCIGCGGCEYICPVRPYRAIYVRGLAKQGEAKPAFDPNEKQQEIKLDDFGF